jgi:hypothetical protein
MPRKQPAVAKRKKIGLHILSVAFVTLVLVGGNVFLLLSPLFGAASTGGSVFVKKNGIAQGVKQRSDASTLFYVQTDGVPSLYFNGKNYQSQRAISGINYRTDAPTVKNTKKAIAQLPPASEILGIVSSADKNVIVFSVLTHVDFKYLTTVKNNTSKMMNQGQSTIAPSAITSVFTYSIKDQVLTKLFDTFKLGSQKIPVAQNITSDNSAIIFNLISCFGVCEKEVPEIMTYDLESGSMKQLGKVLDFQFLGEGNFQFKEFVVEQCGVNAEAGSECYKDPAKLPYKKGSL